MAPPRSGGTGPAADGRLGRYRAKRDPASTPEPPGAPRRGEPAADTAEGGRFVVHEHHARRLHWDLRLERDGVLVCWALPKGLPEAPGENHFAAATEEHPLEYLDFAGVIPKGQYGAGRISVWDEGTYETLKWEPRKVEVALHGDRVDARYALFPIDRLEPPRDWMIHRMDPPADPAREQLPEHLAPMLARAGELPAREEGWAYEVKWDGVRAIAYWKPGELRLESRNLIDITDRYPELAGLGPALGSHSAVLDGEIVAFDSAGRPSFEALQGRMQVSARTQARRLAARVPVTYMLFDLLWLDGHTLTGLPYEQRRQLLFELGLSGERWQTPEHVRGGGRELLAAVREQGLEGLVAKQLASPYEPGARSRSWIKVKTQRRQEFVVGGWTPGRGRRGGLGALLVGVHEPAGALRYAGRVGSGMTEAEIERLLALLEPLRRQTSPFGPGPKPPREARWCEPRLVAEVSFTEWTAAGSLRHPVYVGLRDDVDPDAVVREPPGDPAAEPGRETLRIEPAPRGAGIAVVDGRELRISNLEKVIYPRTGFTKRDLVEYYAAIAPVLLGHLHARPLTVTRWPDGVEGKSFFQKQAPAHTPAWVPTAAQPQRRRSVEHVLVEDLPTLVWLANLAALELHTPLARAQAMDTPTAVVFDLDPGAPAGLLECASVALALHGTFEQLGLRSFVKTSGSKGLQVYLPLNSPEARYEDTKSFARTVAELMAREGGELVVSNMTRARREGRVLIDWSQNDPNKTTVCAYSLRALERPNVSAPLSWEEVGDALDAGDASALVIEAEGVLERVRERGDLFAEVLSLSQALPAH